MEKSCHHLIKGAEKPGSYISSVASGILIAILPKCGFCTLAYSSAIAICGIPELTANSADWTSYISLALVLFTMIMMVINFRGTRTYLSLAVIVAGAFFIGKSELFTGLVYDYNIGVTLVFTGIWINGSFYYFFRMFKRKITTLGHQLFANVILNKSRNVSANPQDYAKEL